MKVKKYKIERVRKEFARLGKVCRVVAVTGYSRTLVSAVVNGRVEPSTWELKENVAVMNSCDMDCYPAPEQANMENFGELQYIIDKLPDAKERIAVEAFFIHNQSKTSIARSIGKSTKVVNRILRNLQKIDLTKGTPTITFRDKTYVLEGLSERNYSTRT